MCNFKIMKNDNGNLQYIELTLIFPFIHLPYMDFIFAVDQSKGKFTFEKLIWGHYDVLHTTMASMKQFFGKVFKNRVDI